MIGFLQRNEKVVILSWLVGLIVFGLGCGLMPDLANLSAETTPTPFVLSGPLSTFVPHRDLVVVEAGQELILKSYHVSTVDVTRLDIWVNGQPVRTEATSAAGGTFPPELATVQIVSGDQGLVAASLTPTFPTSTWTVPLRWVGHVPGRYNLTVQVTDRQDRVGAAVTQAIEVR